MKDRFRVRRMEQEEVSKVAIAWAATEGWNPGLSDADPFYAADPEGYFLGELDGQPAGAISAVAYDDKFGFMGFYIVKPEFRDRGYGMQLWRAALDHLGTRNIGGDGVLNMVKNYEAQGFRAYYKNRRYRGFGLDKPKPRELADILAVDFTQIALFDDGIFPASRHRFLERWICQPGVRGYALLSSGKVAGYGVIRPCYKGFKIGPLFSDDEVTAEKILTALLGCAPADQECFLDVPEVNVPGIRLAESYGMKTVFETARIYSKGSPAVPLEKVFGVTSFELG